MDEALEEEDVRRMVRILGEVAAMESGPDEQRKFLMAALADLLGTDTWVWGVAPLIRDDRQPVYIFHQTGGFDEGRMSRFLVAVDHPDSGAMTAPIAEALIRSGRQVTRARQQIIPDERFLNSPACPCWSAAGIGPLLLALRPLPGYGTSVVGFYRPVDAPAFTARETRIAHIMLGEVPMLQLAGMPHHAAETVPSLPPRCRLVVNHLVRGQSRKEIAAHLNLSLHTVNGYTKMILSHFGVHSQAELIARFAKGDGGDLDETGPA